MKKNTYIIILLMISGILVISITGFMMFNDNVTSQRDLDIKYNTWKEIDNGYITDKHTDVGYYIIT